MATAQTFVSTNEVKMFKTLLKIYLKLLGFCSIQSVYARLPSLNLRGTLVTLSNLCSPLHIIPKCSAGSTVKALKSRNNRALLFMISEDKEGLKTSFFAEESGVFLVGCWADNVHKPKNIQQ